MNNIFYPKISDTPSFPVEEQDHYSFKNGILVRSPNWLGDAVMTFPALRQLKKILPKNCALMVLSPAGFLPLYKALDCVDYVLPVCNAHAFLNRKERKAVREAMPGFGFLFNNSFRDALSLKLAGVPELYGTAARFRSLLLKRAFSFPKRQDHVLNYPHQALKYTAMARAFGAPEWDGVMPSLTPDRTEISPRIKALMEMGDRVLILAPGAAYGDAKRWEPRHFRTVAQWWISRGGFALALGAKKEIPQCTEAVAGLDGKSAVSLAGETSLNDLILLFQHAKMCVGNDSGLMHLAAAAGLPGTAVFASTDPAATAPLSPDWIILHEKQPCSPCFKRDCPDGSRRCFAPITPDKVIDAIQKLL